jgi:hypothetical protein
MFSAPGEPSTQECSHSSSESEQSYTQETEFQKERENLDTGRILVKERSEVFKWYYYIAQYTI